VEKWDQNGSWVDWLEGVDLIRLAQDRDGCECGDEPLELVHDDVSKVKVSG
jgi:hypothetical protein